MKRSQDLARKHRAVYESSHPWTRFVRFARRRCKGGGYRRWSKYQEGKIKCPLTAAQAKILWLRDHADKLKRPSLDRINPKGDYSLENCRFIEFCLNSRLAWDKDAQDQYGPQEKSHDADLDDRSVPGSE